MPHPVIDQDLPCIASLQHDFTEAPENIEERPASPRPISWRVSSRLSRAIDSLMPFAQKLVGHQRVTDAYLLELAIHKRGKLVTMDRAVRTLLPDKSPERDFVVLI